MDTLAFDFLCHRRDTHFQFLLWWEQEYKLSIPDVSFQVVQVQEFRDRVSSFKNYCWKNQL